MLRNVLAVYLERVTERELDLPFLALLPELGFYDIHYTHGQAEFGKDFIAKRDDNGDAVQYSFQSKAGDIGQVEFRRDVLGQLLESVHLGIGHPSFDRRLPHQAVLVTTGRLVGNAPIEMQELNAKLMDLYQKRPVALWDQPYLLERLLEKGMVGVHAATASEVESHGRFYILLGRLMQSDVSERDIEKHSRSWLEERRSGVGPLLAAALESEIIAQKSVELGFLYEAFYVRLAALRAVLYYLFPYVGTSRANSFIEMTQRARESIVGSGRSYLDSIRSQWNTAEKDLSRLVRGPANMFTYLVHCARVLEITGYLYFASHEPSERQDLISFLKQFMECEPGCGHIPSERYASTLVLPTLALWASVTPDFAEKLVRRAVVWLCNRYETGLGLGRWEAPPVEEIQTLLGEAFEFIHLHRMPASYSACVVSDLAKFLGNEGFYEDVFNDLRATRVFGEYWQVPDTPSQLLIDGPDVITYPNTGHTEDHSSFEAFEYAEHIKREPRSFRLADLLGTEFLFAMTVLLRDRYWPGLWTKHLRSGQTRSADPPAG